MHIDNRGNSLCNVENCPAAKAMLDGKTSERKTVSKHFSNGRIVSCTSAKRKGVTE